MCSFLKSNLIDANSHRRCRAFQSAVCSIVLEGGDVETDRARDGGSGRGRYVERFDRLILARKCYLLLNAQYYFLFRR